MEEQNVLQHHQEEVVNQMMNEEVPEQQEVENAQQESATQPQRQRSTGNEVNIRELRLKAEKMQQERDEALRLLKLYQAPQQQAPQAPVVQEDDDFNIAPDELAEGKHLSKVGRKIKKLEDQLKQYHEQTTSATAESRLKLQYNDFDKVVSMENINALREMYPEMANTINSSSSDLYSKGVSAYTMIKKLGIYQEDSYVAQKQLAQSNAAKPRPLASVGAQSGDSPLSRANVFANGLTDELKEQLRKEMVQAMRSR